MVAGGPNQPPSPAPTTPSARGTEGRPPREDTRPRGTPDRPAPTPRPGTGRSRTTYRAPPLPDEVRALWVVRTTLTDPDSIRLMVDRAWEAGFNTLLVQVRGRGDAYYTSWREPKPEAVLQHGVDFDPLALVIHEAHERGLGVHAWVNTYLVGGLGPLPDDPAHLIRARPDLLAVPRELARELYGMEPWSPEFTEALLRFAQRNSNRIEGIYAAPSHPDVKEHIHAVWMDLAEYYDLDGIHFDYVRYANPEFDYSAGALHRFRSWVTPRVPEAARADLDRAFRSDPLAYVDALPGPWAEFRRAQVTDLVERIYDGVKRIRPDLVVSAAVFANADDAFTTRFQDWRGWLDQRILDAVAPMAYTPDNWTFQRQIEEAVAAAGRDRVWAGIGVYQNSFQGSVDKIRIAEELGTRGVVLFSYDWAVAEGAPAGGRTFLQRIGLAMFRR